MMKTTYCMMIALAVAAVGCTRAAEDGKAADSGKPVAVAEKATKMSKSVPKGWIEDFAAAKAQAAKENKKILMAFSGSDWCPWCVKMEKDVYSQRDFIDKASKDFVLVMIDNPQDRSILSSLAATQNEALARQYGISGFPSTLVLDANGKVLESFSGYHAGGPESMLKAISGK